MTSWSDSYVEAFRAANDNKTLNEIFADGTRVGEFTSAIVSLQNDRQAYIESTGGIDNTLKSYIEEKEKTHDLEKEMERIRQQKIQKNINKPGYFKIGTVELTIPPTQIAISDVKQNYIHKTLRTSSDIVLQSGHTTKAMELDLYFHSIDDINNKLRPLLAQLKATPFIPIYSEYLRRVLCPGATDKQSSDFNDKNVQNAITCDDAIEKNRQYVRDILNKNPNIMEIMPDINEKLNLYWDQSLGTNAYGLDQNKTLQENIQKVLTRCHVYDNKADKGSISYITNQASQAIEDLQKRRSSFVSKIPSPIEGKGVVAVLSQINISTVVGFPESIACHASFFVFNHMPFSPGFEFFDKDNGPTFDIDECTYFIQWYVNRFLKPSVNVSDKYFQELWGSLDGKLTMTYYPLPSTEEIAKNENFELKKDVIPLVLTTDHDSVCASISVSQRNSIAFMPVLDWSTPTCQHMGSHNSEILITIDTVDEDFLDKINILSKVMEDFSRSGGDKVRRKNFIEIENEILSFCGVRKGVINSIETQTVEGVAGMNRIQMVIIEFDPKQLKYEAIAGMYETNENIVMEYLKFDIQNYLNYRNQRGGTKSSERILNLLDSDATYRDTILNAIMSERGQQKIGSNPANYSMGLNKLREAAKIGKNSLTSTDNFWNDLFKSSSDSQGGTYSTGAASERRAIDAMVPVLRKEITKKLRVEEIDADYLSMLYNSDSFSYYKVVARETMRSFLQGNRSVIPEGLADTLVKKGLLKDQLGEVVCYPDMSLPTYEKTSEVGKGVPKITNQDIGRKSPNPEEDILRYDEDQVESDFYFYFIPSRKVNAKINEKVTMSIEAEIRNFLIVFKNQFDLMSAEISQSAVYVGKKPSEKKGRDQDIDQILDERGQEELDAVIKEAKKLAEELKSSIESTSTVPTSPEQNTAYAMSYDDASYQAEKGGVLYNFVTYPGIREFVKNSPYTKTYSGSVQEDFPEDSGKSIYGGLIKDASWYRWQDAQKSPSMTPQSYLSQGKPSAKESSTSTLEDRLSEAEAQAAAALGKVGVALPTAGSIMNNLSAVMP